jgi:hypothetical protein
LHFNLLHVLDFDDNIVSMTGRIANKTRVTVGVHLKCETPYTLLKTAGKLVEVGLLGLRSVPEVDQALHGLEADNVEAQLAALSTLSWCICLQLGPRW